ncbi:hypothetical protein DB35_04585 [Streptomyces abyssalis]|uniref:Uncharacterized protein n=1 Tax=Streptomyces abyssalis TaxID=933944 RepID=A0A1E7JQB4_9ACTN|nr:hypothetical protein [Streptomyces abyssalis]OEU90482.1 hypothetical protein AN215_13675 [Streptomyces abyssalis]OEU95219.1 hypothetical protein DB35_04585 [Streptomyces abyssalis]OEV27074.1 hypothetical protein AN219_23640 [Streptomyces nanshensis]
MGGPLVFALVVVTVHALGIAYGGWTLLEENYNNRAHGQGAVMPMGTAWFMTLFCWVLAAVQLFCVVSARERRPWIQVTLAASMMFVVASTGLAFFGSLSTGTSGLVALVVLAVDVAALWAVLGAPGRRWFSVRGTEPASPPGGDRP